MVAASSPIRMQDQGTPPDTVAAGFRAAVDAAGRFIGNTAPNPPVGCAILDRAGSVLALGAHERAGLAHAEPAALAALRASGAWERAHTLLVTLEPCNHHGRTGPCTEAILRSPVREVWIGCVDPNPRVTGHGAARLAAAGLSVRHLPPGTAAALDCQALIAPFRRLAVEGRPWITIKQALDEAESMVPPAGARTFTSDRSLTLAHRLRRATDAIVTGTGTILSDRPGLDVRRLADHPDRKRALVIVGRRVLPEQWLRAASLRFDLRRVDAPGQVPQALAEMGAMWAMAEAGPSLLAGLQAAGAWDDRLLIALAAGGGDDRLAVSVARAGDISPLRVLPELAGCFEEGACSQGS